jgi:hypothetical protein
MLARYFALITGLLFTLTGILGFLPSMMQPTLSSDPTLIINAGYGYLFGLFPVNVVNNVLYLLMGIFGLLAWRQHSSAIYYSRNLIALFGILALLGLVPGLNTAFGIMPLFSHDIWLHGGTAFVAGYFGYVAPSEEPQYENAWTKM